MPDLREYVSRIYELRREKQLTDARNYAETAIKLYIQQNNGVPGDLLKAYAWVMIDLCKIELNAGNVDFVNNALDFFDQFNFNPNDEFESTIIKQFDSLRRRTNPYFARLQEAKRLSKEGDNDNALAIYKEIAGGGNLPSDPDTHESYGWVIYRYLRDHLESLSSVEVRSYLRDYINLRNERPSNLHSQILNLALKYSEKDENFKFINFLRLWGPENLRDDDFVDSRAEDGKTIPSLMARIARAVAKYPIDDVKEFIDILPIRKNDFVDMLRQQYFWNIYHAKEQNDVNELWSLFERYPECYSGYASSEWHSKILSIAERTMEEQNSWRFYSFFKQWGPDKLRDEDWVGGTDDKGHEYSSLAVKAIKKAAETVGNPLTGDHSPEEVKWLLKLFDKAEQKDKDDDWTVRSKAQLLLRIGQRDEAEATYKDLILRMPDKYYIWQEFAGCVTDTRIKKALLCKALSLEKNEDFIGKIKLELAEILLSEGKTENAEYELRTFKKHYEKRGWAVKPAVLAMLDRCSSVTVPLHDNNALYKEMASIAEEYAYADIPATNLLLASIWDAEKEVEAGRKIVTTMVRFTDGRDIEISFPKKKIPALSGAKTGEIWALRLHKEEKKETIQSQYRWGTPTVITTVFYTPLLASKTQLEDWSILPEGCGFIVTVDSGKKLYGIVTSKGEKAFGDFPKGDETFKKGDAVSFKEYRRTVKGSTKISVHSINKCDEGEVLPHFTPKLALVDGVNNGKKLFHYFIGKTGLDGIVHFDQTPLRPKVGDFLKMYYYTYQKKDRNNPSITHTAIGILKMETTEETDPQVLKTITNGHLELKYRSGYDWDEEDDLQEADYAFVEDSYNSYYVSKATLEKYNITHDCRVNGTAIYKGKEYKRRGLEEKWEMISLSEIE